MSAKTDNPHNPRLGTDAVHSPPALKYHRFAPVYVRPRRRMRIGYAHILDARVRFTSNWSHSSGLLNQRYRTSSFRYFSVLQCATVDILGYYGLRAELRPDRDARRLSEVVRKHRGMQRGKLLPPQPRWST